MKGKCVACGLLFISRLQLPDLDRVVSTSYRAPDSAVLFQFIIKSYEKNLIDSYKQATAERTHNNGKTMR